MCFKKYFHYCIMTRPQAQFWNASGRPQLLGEKYVHVYKAFHVLERSLLLLLKIFSGMQEKPFDSLKKLFDF